MPLGVRVLERDPRVLAALARFDHAPALERFHVHARAFSCPVAAVLAHVPRGRVLDVGCGHGLFSAVLALDPANTVKGLDHDPRKLDVAARCVRGANVSFGGGTLADEPAGAYDAVLIIDVLYLVPRARWQAFLADAATRLAPGGVLVLKEVGERPRWKARKMAAQEWVMARLLGRTKGETLAFADAETLAALVRGLGLEVEVDDLSAGYTTPHVLVRGRRPQASAP